VPLTDKQEAFVREYLVDMNGAAAYVRAGYMAASDHVAASCAHKLLMNADIASAIDDAQVARMDRLDLNADWVVARFRLVYLRAWHEGDYAVAIKALENIARYLGIYERDNRQKKYTEADAERIRSELVARGMDFTRKNFPAHGQHVPVPPVPIVVNAGDA
jgi:phage terminase small subunit